MFLQRQKLICAEELQAKLPLRPELNNTKEGFDKTLADIITKKSDKFLIICGPCSADNFDAVREFCVKLKELSDLVKDKIFLMPRVITAKPRSLGEGYLGMLFGDGQNADVNSGLSNCRKLMIECLKIGLPIADELLFIEQYQYFCDLVSYYFLGARSCQSSTHRNFASGIDLPLGVKNPTCGNLNTLSEALYSISKPKTVIVNGEQITTSGASLAHAILRGYNDNDGKFYGNLDLASLNRFDGATDALQMPRSFILADCSHGNSGKKFSNQIANALNVVNNFTDRVGGIMLESYLHEGARVCQYGYSRTDECLSYEQTQELILKLYDILLHK